MAARCEHRWDHGDGRCDARTEVVLFWVTADAADRAIQLELDGITIRPSSSSFSGCVPHARAAWTALRAAGYHPTYVKK